METKMSILFHGKKSKLENEKNLVIYLRVTINRQRLELSTKRSIESGKWNQQAGKAKGNSEEARNMNVYLDILKNKVYTYQQTIMQDGKLFTTETLRMKWFGINEHTHTLVEVFKNHNDQLEALIGQSNTKATFGKYRTTLDHCKEFMQWKFKREDITITNITYSFITDLEFYLKTEKKCNHNSTIKYLRNLRKIINLCIKNGWLTKKIPSSGSRCPSKK